MKREREYESENKNFWIDDERRKSLNELFIAKHPIVHAIHCANFHYARKLFGQFSPLIIKNK